MKDMMMMIMYFHVDSYAVFLFESWETNTPFPCFIGCLFTFLFCFGVAYLSHFKRVYIAQNTRTSGDYASINEHGTSDDQRAASHQSGGHSPKVRLVLSLIFLAQTTCGGLIMLLYMTYNVWVFLAVVLGLTAGYFVVESKNDNPLAGGAASAKHC